MAFNLKLLLMMILFALSGNAYAKPIIIAVVDSGFGYQNKGHGATLCKYGHKDFTLDKQFSDKYGTSVPVPKDTHSHGTNVAGLIDNYLKKKNVDYCLVIIKYYSLNQNGNQNTLASAKALNYAVNIHADYINYSGGGPKVDFFEKKAVESFLNQGGQFIAAAGNEGQNLDNPKNKFYPAMYDSRITVVGNLSVNGTRLMSSNNGYAVTRWEIGQDQTAYGITLSGTSQACAVATGKIVAKRAKESYHGENNVSKQ